jgi:hypothetical protein
MSVKVVTWAWSTGPPSTVKFVLVALADYADDSGFCFPSHRHLAKKCGITERTVRRSLAWLEAHQYISIQPRYRQNRTRSSNRYRVRYPGAQDAGSGEEDRKAPGAACMSSPTGPNVRVTTTESSNKPSPPPQQGERREADRSMPRGGGLCFPKALTAAQCQALQETLASVDVDDAQQVLDELAGRMSVTRVNNPIRYGVALVGRLKRGEFAPELGLAIAESRAAERRREALLQRPTATHPTSAEPKIGALPDDLRAVLERVRPRSEVAKLEGASTADLAIDGSPFGPAIDTG